MTQELLSVNQPWKRMSQLVIQAIEPSFRPGRLSYLLDNDEAKMIHREFDCNYLGVGGWMASGLDLMLYPTMVRRGEWLGRSFATVVQSDTSPDYQTLIGKVLHEFAHYLDMYRAPSSSGIARLALADASNLITRGFLEPGNLVAPAPKNKWDDGHGLRFVRTACHVAYRAQNVMSSIQPSHLRFGPQYYSATENQLIRPLLWECCARKHESIIDILKTPAPTGYVRYWHKLTGVPMPKPQVFRFDMGYRITRSVQRKKGSKAVVLMDSNPIKNRVYEMSGFQMPGVAGKTLDQLPVMGNRTSESASDVVGSLRNIQVLKGQLVGILEFAKGIKYDVEELDKLEVRFKPIEFHQVAKGDWIGLDGPGERVTKWEPVRVSLPRDASPVEQLQRIARRATKTPISRTLTYKPMPVKRAGAKQNESVVVLMTETPRPGANGIPELYLMSGYEPRPNHDSISLVSSAKSLSVRDVVGSVRKITVQGNQLIGIVSFAKDAESQTCLQKHIKENRPFELQVQPYEGWDVPRGRSYNGIQGPLLVVTRWQPLSVAMTGNDYKCDSTGRYSCGSCPVPPPMTPEQLKFAQDAIEGIYEVLPNGQMRMAKEPCACNTKSKSTAACSCKH